MIDDVKLEISKMPLQTAYDLFKVMIEYDHPNFIAVRYGTNICFDIDSLFNKTLHLVIRKKRGIILINGKKYMLDEFNSELNDREKTVKKFLFDNSEKISLTTDRSNSLSTGITHQEGIIECLQE